MYRFLLYFLLIASCLAACTDSPTGPTYRYVHLAHTRAAANPHLDSVVETTDWARFDQLWLGGDLLYNTSLSPAYLARVDSLLYLSSPTTHLAPGNHDYDDPARLSATTGRPLYYFTQQQGVGLLVLDTQDSLSHIRGEQLAFVRRTLADLPPLSHLVVLHHKLIWLDDDGPLRERVSAVANGGYGAACDYCINPNNFYRDVYPLLVQVEQNGTDVICLAGDVGFKVPTFHHLTAEGIDLLASGLNYRVAEKWVLLFEHAPGSGQLSWRFARIADL